MATRQSSELSNRVRNRIGIRYGRLVVLSYAGFDKRGKDSYWFCQCDCGKEVKVAARSLKDGSTVSCGCYRRERSVTHGLTETREYAAWCAAKSRCRINDSRRQHYHERGIQMCEEWLHDFQAFLKEVGPCPPGCSLDRIDNDRGYEPGNCRWTNQKTQNNNRRTNRLITHEGITMNLQQWSERTGIQAGTIAYRLNNGWPISLALSANLTISQARNITSFLRDQ